MSEYTLELLCELKNKPLEEKIILSKLRITEFYEHYKGNVIVSFSGGKDSTVLLHLVRSLYSKTKAVYCDTGLEVPEVKAHVKQTDNVEIIRPQMSFREVLDTYGWLVPTKDIAYKIYYARRGKQWARFAFQGLDNKGNPSAFRKHCTKWAYLVDAPFNISSMCCDIMKKRPFAKYLRSIQGGGVHWYIDRGITTP